MAESRAEIDQVRCGPWSRECLDIFNNKCNLPDVPEISGGAAQSDLDQFDPSMNQHERSGGSLKTIWSNMRSWFSIAYTRWTASGQGEV
jgi:hypothetical protein